MPRKQPQGQVDKSGKKAGGTAKSGSKPAAKKSGKPAPKPPSSHPAAKKKGGAAKKPLPDKPTGSKAPVPPKSKKPVAKTPKPDDGEIPPPKADDEDSDESQPEDSGSNESKSDQASNDEDALSISSDDKKPAKRRKGKKLPAAILTRAETVMDHKYSGGTNLSTFAKEFKAMAHLNEWTRAMSIFKLKSLLAGQARTFVDTLLEETGSHLRIDDIFDAMRAEFVTPAAMAVAVAKVETMKRKEDESALEFGARWVKAWRAAGQPNDASAAIKFFKSCSEQGYGEGLVYSQNTHKTVTAVAEALQGLEMTELWRVGSHSKKRKHRHTADDDSDSRSVSSEDKQHGKRRGSSSAKSVDAASLAHQVNSLVVAAVETSMAKHFGTQTQPVAPPGEPNIVCQLCNTKGHSAFACTVPQLCGACMLPGHNPSKCPYKDGTCLGCGQVGHLLLHCPTRRGRGSGGFRGRGRGRGQADGQPKFHGDCYNCGQPGHSARYCTSNAKAAPVKKEQSVAWNDDQLERIADSLAKAAERRSEKTRERQEAGARGAPKEEK